MTNKAIRATLQLSDQKLDVFQMPDSDYVYPQTDAFISIADEGYDTQQAAKRYIEKTTSKQAQTLIPQGFSRIVKVKIEGENQTFNAISQADVSNLWLLFAMDGNTKAVKLLAALAQEALERRADAAFGIQRSEEERNQRLASRTQGKVARRYLTDSIADYLEANPDLSDTYRKFIWSNCSDHLNLIILGAKAKQAKEFLEVPKNSLLRNHIPIAALNELERVEDLASRIIDEKGTEPLEAVKQAAILMMTKTIGLI